MLEKYRREDKLKTDTTETTQKMQTTQNTTKQNYTSLVVSYGTRPGKEVGLFWNTPEPTRRLKRRKFED